MKYSVTIFCGRVMIGNGIFETIEECYTYMTDDEFCEHALITDHERKIVLKVKVSRKEK